MKSVRLDTDSSKGRSEEVAEALGVSLNRIDNFRSDGGRTRLLGHTTDSGGGGVTESFASEIKSIGRISFLYRIINCCLHAQSKALHQIVEQVYGSGGTGEVSFMQLLHAFWSHAFNFRNNK